MVLHTVWSLHYGSTYSMELTLRFYIYTVLYIWSLHYGSTYSMRLTLWFCERYSKRVRSSLKKRNKMEQRSYTTRSVSKDTQDRNIEKKQGKQGGRHWPIKRGIS